MRLPYDTHVAIPAQPAPQQTPLNMRLVQIVGRHTRKTNTSTYDTHYTRYRLNYELGWARACHLPHCSRGGYLLSSVFRSHPSCEIEYFVETCYFRKL